MKYRVNIKTSHEEIQSMSRMNSSEFGDYIQTYFAIDSRRIDKAKIDMDEKTMAPILVLTIKQI